MGKSEQLSWDELRERMSAIAGGPAHHSFSENEVSEMLAEALARVMERLEAPKPKRAAPKKQSKSSSKGDG